MDKMLKFDLPKNQSSIIKVIGVGGGGSNAVSHMYKQGIEGVDFLICNTDAQAMEASSVPTKVQLGSKGLGAGSLPSVGKEAAIENIEDVKLILEKNTKMLFITAGMGGGTGTGGAPIIAETAKELGILTVGIVTTPFSFEGRKRKLQAEAGIEELRKSVDTLLIICNDKLREVHGDLKLSEAFQKADNILAIAAKGIAEIITVTGYINVDFEDVKTVMKDSGSALMGSAIAEGENRAIKAVEDALASPLLNDNQIKGADNILLYMSSGEEEITMDEVMEITDYIQNESGQNAEIIWGNGKDESLGNKISITLVATGFNPDSEIGVYRPKRRIVHPLTTGHHEENKSKPRITEPISEITLITPKKEETEKKEEITSAKIKSKEKEIPKTQTLELSFKQDKEKLAEEIKNIITEKKSDEEIKLIKPADTIYSKNQDFPAEIERDEIEKKSKERIRKLKDLSIKLRSPNELDELEKTPAYIRRKVELMDVKPSSEAEGSRYVLTETDDKKTEIKKDNSFLHDNVD
ncbi:MAG: cell division protein FtsZ [Bacteroidales bacterium]|nr:cell division protein FtsZ [Bacteroidales bacterium]